ncbi:TetR/AcrR family transcriptional regulator [Aestuariibius insulae]|uniref:TetR/AcrR family transcriptional regulator n=1 Tax=Aestuariibius insulae TaxID=2058287 RepID=UPI00345E75BD
MARQTEQRRDALRTNLTEEAERRIRGEGLASLKARPLAEAVGCSVGAIYNVFPDLTALVLTVNGRTFRRLGADIEAAVQTQSGGSPPDRLHAMAITYLRFAAANRTLWHSLFDVEMADPGEIPDWYDEELERLFSFISSPLKEIFPDKDADEIEFLTRTLFSSVHGIVLLGLEQRGEPAPSDELERRISYILNVSTKT